MLARVEKVKQATIGGRRRGDGRALRLRIPPDPRFSKAVRDEILAFARNSGVSRPGLDNFKFAIGEAIANAIEHSHTRRHIEVEAYLEADRVVAVIHDFGTGLDREKLSAPLPDDFAEHGRGIPIMRRCTDFLNVRSTPGRGTSVTIGILRDYPALP